MFKRVFSAVISVVIIITFAPVTVFAVEQTDESEGYHFEQNRPLTALYDFLQRLG